MNILIIGIGILLGMFLQAGFSLYRNQLSTIKKLNEKIKENEDAIKMIIEENNKLAIMLQHGFELEKCDECGGTHQINVLHNHSGEIN